MSRTSRDFSIPLARGGQPQFEIVLPRGASAPEEFAADELRRTLYAMIGREAYRRTPWKFGLATIFINDPEAARRAGINPDGLNLPPEGFHIETRGGNLYLFGGGRRGTLYGVYDLLESLGCRWFTPEISRIPRTPNLTLPALCKTDAPAFESRDIFNTECRDALWWVRNRLNGQYTPVREYMGGSICYFGFVHTFYGLLPPGEFFDSHPEYFSLVAGQRRRDLSQLCLTHPDVLRIVIERVLERMKANPQATIFSVSQNDCLGYCECESCRAVAEAEASQSGPMLHFVNAVAAETAKHFPNKLIDTLAYQYSLDAPRQVVPHPNVRVRLCSINCCQGHPYGACDHPESQRFLQALEAWGRRTSQLYVWHYATNFNHYPLPMPDFDELHGNLNLYRRSGVRGVFVQGMGEPGGGAESMALRGYLLSKLLWKPDQPVWPLVDEFLPAYYGAAAPGVRRYLEIFHHAVRQDASLHPSLYDLPSHRLYDDDLRLPADEALAAAETLVTGEQRQRVRLLRGGLRYARLHRACGSFQRRGELYAGDAHEPHARELDDLIRVWEKSGVQRIREGEELSFTAPKLRGRLRPHAVYWLEDGQQSLALVPGLGGRLIEWNACGQQWLAPAAPDSTWGVHPYSGGYSEFAAVGMHATRGWCETYTIQRQSHGLRLTARLDGGLRLSRRLWLEGGKLQVRSRVKNLGAQPVECGWGAAIQLRLPGRVQVEWMSAIGKQVIPWDGWPPEGGLTLTGEKLPLGHWRIAAPQGILAHEIVSPPLARFSLSRGDGSLWVEWRTGVVTLAPGQEITTWQAIGFESPR
jgi:hypothetical protein